MVNIIPPSDRKRYLVLLDKDHVNDGIQAVRQRAQLPETMRIANTTDAPEGFLEQEQMEQSDMVVLNRLGIALVNSPLEMQQSGALSAACQEQHVPIVAVVEEETWQALGTQLLPETTAAEPLQYLQGYRDGTNQLIDNLMGTQPASGTAATALPDASATWGIQATRVLESPYSGAGIRIAVLDTGMDLNHPDFVGRTMISRSFIPGVASAQDGNSHGTHCIGTACGPQNPSVLPRYGIAYESEIYVGKVLNDNGSGSTFDIVNGIEWAIVNNCAVISLSLGGPVRRGQTFSRFYEDVGDRALDAGSLIIAASGNSSRRPSVINPVGSPANCPSFMAVSALDPQLQIARFSDAGINPDGGEINIAGPGVDVYSSAPDPALNGVPARYQTISGTSMATPHVSGIAALYAQATGRRGQELWNLLTRNARRLPLMARDIGSGLVQAPRQ